MQGGGDLTSPTSSTWCPWDVDPMRTESPRVRCVGPSYLHLLGADVELAEDVAEEVLDLIPGVDAVGAIQHDHNVHVGAAPCSAQHGAQDMYLMHRRCVCVCVYIWVCV